MPEEPQDPLKRRLRIAIIVSLILLVGVAALIVMLGGDGVAYESPRYRVVETMGEVEVRQ